MPAQSPDFSVTLRPRTVSSGRSDWFLGGGGLTPSRIAGPWAWLQCIVSPAAARGAPE